jgi:23S rRNA (guanine745-N1)-methyltransferase
VRDCRRPLARQSGAFVCASRHSFDLSRSGYLNLLQPQDRRSKQPGDTTAAIAARRRIHDRGITAPLLKAIADLLQLTPADRLLDAGCGEGFYPGELACGSNCEAAGIDISAAAIDAAARRYSNALWIVANADRAIPFADATFTTIMSITARRNPAEFRRVLEPSGRVLLAIPAPDDLTELRGPGRDRTSSTIAECNGVFELLAQSRATTTALLDSEAVEDFRHAIYRPLHSEPPVASQLTLSLDLLLFRAS